MNATAMKLLEACRFPKNVPEQRVGLWQLMHHTLEEFGEPSLVRDYFARKHGGPLHWETWTCLYRDTMETIHRAQGECVMDDSLLELRRHLPILLAASGRVLISGLGMGCVVRGLLSKPEVTHIDVVEIDPAIAELVGDEFTGNPRVSLRMGDAESIEWNDDDRWDFAWHDVWSEHERLAVVHARLIARYDDRCPRQGAWQFDRAIKRRWPVPLIGAARRRESRAVA